jgi:hypothetical protein
MSRSDPRPLWVFRCVVLVTAYPPTLPSPPSILQPHTPAPPLGRPHRDGGSDLRLAPREQRRPVHHVRGVGQEVHAQGADLVQPPAVQPARARGCACMHASVRACVRACVCARAHVVSDGPRVLGAWRRERVRVRACAEPWYAPRVPGGRRLVRECVRASSPPREGGVPGSCAGGGGTSWSPRLTSGPEDARARAHGWNAAGACSSTRPVRGACCLEARACVAGSLEVRAWVACSRCACGGCGSTRGVPARWHGRGPPCVVYCAVAGLCGAWLLCLAACGAWPVCLAACGAWPRAEPGLALPCLCFVRAARVR